MNTTHAKILGALGLCGLLFLSSGAATAGEVEKGGIPAAHLAESYKALDWGVKVWDLPEAMDKMKAEDKKVVWVDTRPASFFTKGTVRGAVNLAYDKKGSADNALTADSLAKAVADAGLTKETATVAFFCQGPTCHRSYNASFVAVTEWGYPAANVIWFRPGYPDLFKKVKEDAAIKRKAKSFIDDIGMKEL